MQAIRPQARSYRRGTNDLRTHHQIATPGPHSVKSIKCMLQRAVLGQLPRYSQIVLASATALCSARPMKRVKLRRSRI